MNIAVEEWEGVTVVAPLIRRLDASVAGVFRQEVVSLIEQGHHQLLLDFSQVDFIDSSCLGALVSLLKLLNNRGDLRLCGLNDNILGMFRITRMDRVFHIGADRQQALARPHT
ncbi:STAS domain-containing protein [Edwardsiella tarda]|uniref:Anti-sigma factor antagonist n=2 Tax=Edwardsiella tarda TaxID=636 RepID=A0A2A7U0S9_EDWTA|nr:STAS domain-containing protein [Edwardsiella tarda]AKH88313.1 STAS domain-containing protein [Edwardsiella tarda]ATI64907.1 anti-sigma factor antagonist [Edwardsiella tarda]PEH71878.1 anti-sigma factor antagonist [Edwardsiella tarda]UAL56024.1 STAS domain-containing protein [Edwardsiella tarda]UCQ00918.1 STAS domain-containing protein [Edwardsiella tarda ATCC 15947 = NBRC 105688]